MYSGPPTTTWAHWLKYIYSCYCVQRRFPSITSASFALPWVCCHLFEFMVSNFRFWHQNQEEWWQDALQEDKNWSADELHGLHCKALKWSLDMKLFKSMTQFYHFMTADLSIINDILFLPLRRSFSCWFWCVLAWLSGTHIGMKTLAARPGTSLMA